MFSAAVALVPSTGWTIPRTRKLTLNHLGRAAARAASNERTISVPPDEPIRAPLERSSPSNTAAAAAAAAPGGQPLVDNVFNNERQYPLNLDERVYQVNRMIIDSVKGLIDIAYANNDFARFYVLETVSGIVIWISVFKIESMLMITRLPGLHTFTATNDLCPGCPGSILRLSKCHALERDIWKTWSRRQ